MVSSRSSSAAASPEPSATMQIFIKPITGDTISLSVPPTATIDNIRTLLSLQTHKPASTFRLVHAGKHITAYKSTLESLDITSESTLTLAKPLRGGMPSKKLRCGAKECREQAQRFVGDCGFCNGHFCGKHRLLEDHKCTGLEDVSRVPSSPASEASASSELSSSEIESLDIGLTTLSAGESEDDTVASTSSSTGAESGEQVTSRISVLEGLKKVAGGNLQWWLAGLDLDEMDLS